MENIPELHFILRMALATFLGLCIGIERQRFGKIAGIRTYSTMALATSLFTLMAIKLFPSEQTPIIIAAIIISAGLVSARTYVVDQNKVQDFSNIVALWATTAIAVAVSYGMYIVGATAAFLLIAIYILKDFIEPQK